MGNITSSLQNLFEKNDRCEGDGPLRQQLALRSMSVFNSVPTLQPGVDFPITQMLRARFEFGDTWVNAAFGHTWLGFEEMASAVRCHKIVKHLETRKKYFEGHLLQVESWGRISLFGIDLDQGEETLLHWCGSGEPAVVTYVGHEVNRYSNLQAFIAALVK